MSCMNEESFFQANNEQYKNTKSHNKQKTLIITTKKDHV